MKQCSVAIFLCIGLISALQAEQIELVCNPKVVYKGDTLTVKLPLHHDRYEFAVVNENGEQLLISFWPRPEDTVAPVIVPTVPHL